MPTFEFRQLLGASILEASESVVGDGVMVPRVGCRCNAPCGDTGVRCQKVTVPTAEEHGGESEKPKVAHLSATLWERLDAKKRGHRGQ